MDEPHMEAVAGRPALPLRSVIRRYRGYRTQSPPGTHRGLPSRHLTFIISLDRPVDIASLPGKAQSPGQFQAFVGGMHSGPASIRHDGYQYGISLELTPLGSRTLFGVPAGELASSVVDLESLLGRETPALLDRLMDAPTWTDRFTLLDDVLVCHLKGGPGPPAEVAWAWQRLVNAGGGIEIDALAGEVGYSRRHLGELFRRELGLSPKVAARVLRFEHSRRLLSRAAGSNLASVAAMSGYYDQAHLTREWREMAGCSPTTWMAEELPYVQDEPTEMGAH